jgi:hypothetical protein
MIEINKYYKGLSYTQKWFCEKINPIDCLKVIAYKQVDIDVKSNFLFIKNDSYTLHSDLTSSKDDILKKFSSTIRNEINRSEREGCVFIANESKENFIAIYNEFASQRGIEGVSLSKLNSYNDNLILTSTTKDGVITAVHSYLVDFQTKKIRFLHGGTQRFSENIDRNMIARSNKYLHFRDMMLFKEKGYLIYDWGGIAYQTEDKGLKGINKFKESFGGDLKKQKELLSFFYFLILKLFK